MPTSTYDLIASNVLTSSASSVTFSSIPATYRDLVVVVQSDTSPAVQFNGDTASNYHRVVMYGDGSTTGSLTGNNPSIYGYGVGGKPTIIQVMDYSATDKHKSVLIRNNNSASGVDAVAGRWANTAAINEVKINADFISGNSVYLYGIVS